MRYPHPRPCTLPVPRDLLDGEKYQLAETAALLLAEASRTGSAACCRSTPRIAAAMMMSLTALALGRPIALRTVTAGPSIVGGAIAPIVRGRLLRGLYDLEDRSGQGRNAAA